MSILYWKEQKLKRLREEYKELEQNDKELFDIVSEIPYPNGSGSWEDDELEFLDAVFTLVEKIENFVRKSQRT